MTKPIAALEPPDSIHLDAVLGWLGLGNVSEAVEELAHISSKGRVHPDVLKVRWQVYAEKKEWEKCLDVAEALVALIPEQEVGWIHRSYALHELGKTREALDHLLPVATNFTDNWIIPFNLAGYCAQLGLLQQAAHWLKIAMAIDEKTVKEAAIGDRDLKPLWDSMGGTIWKKE